MLLEREGELFVQESKVIIERGVVIDLPFSQPIVWLLQITSVDLAHFSSEINC